MNRYIFDKFDDEALPTFWTSFKQRQIFIPGSNSEIKLNLWDTAGQEKFKSVTKMYFWDAEAAVVVYDVTFRGSFEAAREWVRELKEHATV